MEDLKRCDHADPIKICRACLKEAMEKANIEHHCVKCQEAHLKPPYQCPNCIGIGAADERERCAKLIEEWTVWTPEHIERLAAQIREVKG